MMTAKKCKTGPRFVATFTFDFQKCFSKSPANFREIGNYSVTLDIRVIFAYRRIEFALRNTKANIRVHRSALPALSCASRAVVWVTFVFAARKLGRRLLTFLFVLRDWKTRTIYSERERICATTISDAAARSAKLTHISTVDMYGEYVGITFDIRMWVSATFRAIYIAPRFVLSRNKLEV